MAEKITDRIQKLTGTQARIALIAIYQGKVLKTALDDAETWNDQEAIGKLTKKAYK